MTAAARARTARRMRQWTVDAFASEPFMGNGACVLEPFADWPAAERMQALAAENRQAETAFLKKTSDPARYELRWFTPAIEVKLCGHATLASAHVLFAELGSSVREFAFETASGTLRVARAGRGYAMDFPAEPPTRIDPPDGLAEALGARPKEVWSGRYLIAVLEGEEAVRSLEPDIGGLKGLNVGVTSPASADAPYDVVSRFFAPASGIAEDPATGSLHCILAPLFAAKLGRPRIKFHQAYPGRGGDLRCELRGERVEIEGEAVTVLAAELRAPL